MGELHSGDLLKSRSLSISQLDPAGCLDPLVSIGHSAIWAAP